MKIIGVIILVILGISLLLLTCMGLYALWFMAFPEFINKIKNKHETYEQAEDTCLQELNETIKTLKNED